MAPVERAKADLVRMQAELTKLQQRIEKVRAYIEMVAVYENLDGGDAPRASRGGGSHAISRAAVDLLNELKHRVHTKPLMRALIEQGVHIGGSNPAANLSAILSRTSELNSNRALGWGLATWGDAPEQGPANNTDWQPSATINDDDDSDL